MNNLTTQQTKLHELLLEKGNEGVNSWDATYKFNIKQAPTRKSELANDWGCLFTRKRNRNGSVNWIHLGCKEARIEEKPIMPQQWQLDQQAMDRQVKVWSKNLKRYVWEDVREPEQMSI